MISSLFIVAFVLVDGLVRGNSLDWAAPWRAGLLGVLIVGALVAMRVSGHRLDFATMGLVGVIGAMLVSDAFHNIGGLGLPAFVLYAGAFAWQRTIKHDWRAGLAWSGVIISSLVMLTFVTHNAPPNAMWNRNVIAGTLAMMLPAAFAQWEHKPVVGWLALWFCMAAICVTLSRGAIMAATVTVFVLMTEHIRFPRWSWITLGIAAPAAFIGLMALKPVQTIERTYFIRQAVEQWWATSPLFGVGPGQIFVTAPGKSLPDYHAHNALVSLMSQVGLAGGGVLSAVLGVSQRRIGRGWQRWQIAALASVAVHSLVDDPLTWWPTGLMVALILGSN
jgi:hypothetical protein